MLQLLYAIALIFLYLILYYMTGSLAAARMPSVARSVPLTLILGFFCYFFLFSVCDLPMKITLQPLSHLSLLWGAVILLIVILFFILKRKTLKKDLSALKSTVSRKPVYILMILLLLILLQVVLINLNDDTISFWDQSYFVGDSVTSLYTNTISQYNPYTGRILSHLDTEYLLETLQNHTAVMSQIFNIHPLIENQTVMASVVVIIYNLIAWEIGLELFRGDRLRALFLNGFLALLNFFSFNLHAAGEFLIIRPGEGKTILAVLIIPALLLFFLKTIKEVRSAAWWISSFLVILGSFGLNMSSIYMIPFEVTAFYVPLAIHEKKWSVFLRYLVLLIPCALMAAAYLLTKYVFIIEIP